MVRTLPICLLAFVASSCAKEQDLSGHYVSESYYQGRPYRTLTISKNTFWINKYALNADNFEIGVMKFVGNRYIVLDEGREQVWVGFGVQEIRPVETNTLLVKYSYRETFRFIRTDSATTYFSDLFCDLLLSINLPEYSGPGDEFINPYYRINVNIGKPTKVRKDSIQIQVNDVLIGMAEIPTFIKQQKAMYDEADFINLRVCLNADKLTQESVLQDVVNQIRDSDSGIGIFRSYIDSSTGVISYRQYPGQNQ